MDESRAVATRYELTDTFAHRGSDVSFRWLLVHLIEEYSRHNGHADLLREAIDGQTGDQHDPPARRPHRWQLWTSRLPVHKPRFAA